MGPPAEFAAFAGKCDAEGIGLIVDPAPDGFPARNTAWTKDTLRYMKSDPVQRRHLHNDLTSGLGYALSETFVLPLGHEEVVRGKGSLIGRMPGDDWQQFANLRA